MGLRLRALLTPRLSYATAHFRLPKLMSFTALSASARRICPSSLRRASPSSCVRVILSGKQLSSRAIRSSAAYSTVLLSSRSSPSVVQPTRGAQSSRWSQTNARMLSSTSQPLSNTESSPPTSSKRYTIRHVCPNSNLCVAYKPTVSIHLVIFR